MDRITGIILIIVAGFFLWSLRTVPLQAATFPAGLILILIGLSLFLVIGKWKNRYPFENIKDVGIAALLMIAYTLLLPVTGFAITTSAMLLASMWLGGYRRPRYKPLIVAVLLTACIYIVFFTLLDVPPP